MTNDQLKDLQDKLWDAANSLRAYGGESVSKSVAMVINYNNIDNGNGKVRFLGYSSIKR